jgi:hypothetical protein
MIGSLSHLIRGAAVEAVLDGSEKITRETLDRVGLDRAAEAARTRRKSARRRRDRPRVSARGGCPSLSARLPARRSARS